MSTNFNRFVPVLSGTIESLRKMVAQDILNAIKEHTVHHNGITDPLKGESADAVFLITIIRASDNSHVTEQEAALLLGRVCRFLEKNYAEASDKFNNDFPFVDLSANLRLYDTLTDAVNRVINDVLSAYFVNPERAFDKHQ